jgi:hypothetical protein
MTEEEMIAKFLATNVVKQIDSGEDEYGDSRLHGRTKAYISSHDYKPDPMWDGLVVLDNTTKTIIEFTVGKGKQTANAYGKLIASTFTYDGAAGAPMRENTITERIASGRYSIRKNPRQN